MKTFVPDYKAQDVLRITIPLAETDVSALDLCGYGLALKGFARRLGGDGRVFRGPDAVWIDLRCVTREQIDPAISACEDSVLKKMVRCKFVMALAKPIPMSIVPGEYLREKLTRKFLFALPMGAFVISNLLATRYSPRWVAHLTQHVDRERLWEKAIDQRVAHRTATVLWSEEDCTLFQTLI